MDLKTAANSTNSANQASVTGRRVSFSQGESGEVLREQFAKDLLRIRGELRKNQKKVDPKLLWKPEPIRATLPVEPRPVREKKKIGPIYETLPIYYTKGVTTPGVSDDVQAEEVSVSTPNSRTRLSDEQIDALAGKYDVRKMPDEQYDAFLDDLEDMGAITGREKEFLDHCGKSEPVFPDENGQIVTHELEITAVWGWEGANPPAFNRADTDGDVLRWVTDRLKWKPEGKTAAQQERQAKEIDIFENLSTILARMTGTQPVTAQKGGSTEEDEEPGIIDQLRDPGSAFYQDMFQRMRIQLEESEEEKEKQAIIDALSAILEGMRSTDGAYKRKDMVSSMAELSKQISQLDEDDPRRTQLDLFRQRLNRMGIYIDLDAGGKGGKQSLKTGETLTQFLIREEKQTSNFDSI